MKLGVISSAVLVVFLTVGCNSGGADRAELEQRTTSIAADLVEEAVSALGFMLDDMGAGDAAAWLENWLNNVVFQDSQVESEQPGRVVYLLQGRVVCTGQILGLIMGGCHGDEECEQNRTEFRQKCAAKVDRIGVRLELTDAGDGVDLSLQVGEERHPLASLSLTADSLALSLDLDEMNPGLVTILAAFDFDPPMLPEELTGSLLVELQLTDEGLLATAQIPEDGAIVVGPLNVRIAAAPDLAVVEVAEALQSLEVWADLNAVSASFAGKIPYLNYHAKLGLDLSGLSGAVYYGGSLDTLAIRDFAGGPGKSMLLLNDQMLIGLDINAPAGGPLSAQLAPGPDFPLIGLLPGVHVDLDFNAGPIDELLGFELGFLPDALRGLSYRIALEDEEHFQLVPTFNEQGDWKALEILSGLARLSDSEGSEVTVEQGSCVGLEFGCFLETDNFVSCFSSESCD